MEISIFLPVYKGRLAGERSFFKAMLIMQQAKATKELF
jgi:hypothetical protein